MATLHPSLPPEIAAIWHAPLRVSASLSLEEINTARAAYALEALPSNELLTDVLLCHGFTECLGKRYQGGETARAH